MPTKLCALALHCLYLEERGDFCKKAQLVRWPNAYQHLHAEGVIFSNSHQVILSACSSQLRTISLDPFYSAVREVPCGSGGMNKGLLYGADHIHLDLLAWEGSTALPLSSPFPGQTQQKDFRKKETGLLKG